MAQYVVGLDSSLKRIFVWKTTGDPTTLTNWSAQDTGITHNYQIKSMWAVLDGTDIHIAYQLTLLADGIYTPVYYAEFDTTTDSFAIRGEMANNPSSTAPTAGGEGCSIGVRSDGDVIVFYARANDVEYARRESGTWAQSTVKTNNEPFAGVLVMGASDRAHFFYFENIGDDILHRSLSSGNSLDTEATVDAAVGASVLHPIGRGIAYPDNGNTVIKAPYLDADESITSVRIDVSTANPTIATDTAASDNDAEDINSSVVACMAIDDTNTWLIYSGGGVSGVDQDIYSDEQADGGSWGTDTEENDAVTANRLSSAVYNRGGTDYLAYVWLDGVTTNYDEIALAAPPAPIPDRLYKVEQAINRSGTY